KRGKSRHTGFADRTVGRSVERAEADAVICLGREQVLDLGREGVRTRRARPGQDAFHELEPSGPRRFVEGGCQRQLGTRAGHAPDGRGEPAREPGMYSPSHLLACLAPQPSKRQENGSGTSVRPKTDGMVEYGATPRRERYEKIRSCLSGLPA